MSITVMLTGLLPFVVIIASLLAIPVSLVLLRMYKRAVRRGMTTGGSIVAAADPAPRSAPGTALEVKELPSDSRIGFDNMKPILRIALFGRWRTATVYAAAGGCYAAIMTGGLLLSDRTQSVVVVKLTLLFWTFLWPVVPAAMLVAAYDWIRRVQVLAAYFGVLLLVVGIAVSRNPGLGPPKLILYWILTNGPPTVLIMAFLYRPVRAVGPLVLAFLIAISVGSQVVLSVAERSESFLRAVSHAGYAIALSATGVFVAMIVVGVLVFGLLLGWPLLKLLGRRYGERKFSDQSLLIDALWLIFAVVQSIDLAFNRAGWILTGVVAFLGYKLVAVFGFRFAVMNARPSDSETLLLLRVFALGRRSEKFFATLRKHWQFVGSILMIAGPDLVATTVEPHEFLDFMRGRVGRRFISDAKDVERRISAVDKVPDPDGRYRIAEFFCHNDTWQMTMARLAASSNVVLMDLRSFSTNNRGCIYELGRLLDGIDLNRVVFLVDSSTDRSFLETTVQSLWWNLSVDSPNRAQSGRSVRLFSIATEGERELRSLVGVLLGGVRSLG
jgi:hypothetical protein